MWHALTVWWILRMESESKTTTERRLDADLRQRIWALYDAAAFVCAAAAEVLGENGGMVRGPATADCPVCLAISPDHCQLRQCRWEVTDE